MTPDRSLTFAAFLARLPAAPVIVETGCQRQEADAGAGESTSLFGRWLRDRGGRLVSLDVSEKHCRLARRVCAGLPVEVVCADSVGWLRGYQGPPFDGLYVDSLDTTEPGSAAHALAEVVAAVPHLTPAGVVLIDDTPGGWTGKGEKAGPWLLANGWRVVLHGYQALLVRE